MSFILNALKKSEEERQTVQSEPVQDRIPDREDVKKKKRPLWLIILSLANLCLLFYLIWMFLLKDEPDTSKEKTPHVVEKSKIIVENKKVTKPVEVEKVKKIVKPPIREQVKPKTSLSRKDEVKPNKSNNRGVVNTKVETDERSLKQTKSQQLSISQRLETQRKETLKRKQIALKSRKMDNQQAIKKENSPFAKRTYVPRPSKDNSVETQEQNRSNPPYLSGMSYEFRRTVPNIQINVFVYSEKEEDRMVMIEMRKYQAGMDIAKNMTLKEIRKNSIVVEYDGKVFQIKR